MANEYLVNSDDLVSVADAIRSRGKTTEQLVFPGGFVTAIDSIGGSGATLTVTTPAEGVTVTVAKGELSYTKTTGADGTAVFSGLESGTWTITIGKGTVSVTGTVDINADYEVPMNLGHIYGISRDVTSSSPVWTRTDESVGKTATASVGTAAGSSDFDACYPWSGIQRETLSTNDVMVKIPKFWYRRYMDGNVEHIKIADNSLEGFTLHPLFNHGGVESECAYIGAYTTSNNNRSISGAAPTAEQTRATFRTNAKAKGNGWGILDIAAVSAIQMLILIEFATNNVQAAIGRGNCDQSEVINSGSCNNVPNLTGRPSGTDGLTGVVWRGIENFWGNAFDIVDGINCNNGTYYVCNDQTKYADDTVTGYEKLSFSGNTSWLNSYITKEGLDTGSNPHVMLPEAAGSGSESTYQCDTVWGNSGWRRFEIGGSAGHSSKAGLFSSGLHNLSSTVYKTSCSRLLYIPA